MLLLKLQFSFWGLALVSGVKLSDASKKLGKKFATGASVVKVCKYYKYLPAFFILIFIFFLQSSNDLILLGPNWERANWCSRGHILWHCGIHYRHLACCNFFKHFFSFSGVLHKWCIWKTLKEDFVPLF